MSLFIFWILLRILSKVFQPKNKTMTKQLFQEALNSAVSKYPALTEQEKNNLIYLLSKQSFIETGNWQSRLFTNFNNAFGMRPAERRKKIYSGVEKTANGDFAVYKNVFDSVRDRLDLMKSVKEVSKMDWKTFVNYLAETKYFGKEDKINYLKY
jgi:uncharacterized FlgJ-related protein